MHESQSPDEQLICVRLCKVVQSFWILQSIQCVSQNESIQWRTTVGVRDLSQCLERQSKSSNNLQNVHKDLLVSAKEIPVMQTTNCFDENVDTNHQFTPKCSPGVSLEITTKLYDENRFF